MPKFHKLYRGICLAMFALSGAYSFYNPHVIKTVALSLVGLVAYDIICLLRQKSEAKDYGPEFKVLSDKVAETSRQIGEMKDDVSVAKLANTFRRG